MAIPALAISSSQKAAVDHTGFVRNAMTSVAGSGFMSSPPDRCGARCRTPHFESNAHESQQDAPTRLERPVEGARNFRDPAGSAAVCNRQLYHVQSRSCGAHLHLEVPAIGHLFHAEAEQHIA